MGVTRREWLKATLAMAGVSVLAAACSDDDAKPTLDQGTPADKGTAVDQGGPADSGPAPDIAGADSSMVDQGAQACRDSAITSNHGHFLDVPRADVDAGTEKTYSIQGTSAHDHQVTITATDFTQLAANQSITVTSTNDAGHTHDVTVSCAA